MSSSFKAMRAAAGHWARHRTARAWLVRAAAAMALVWGLGWWALPIALKAALEHYGTEALGRSVSVGHVAFRPWSLELQVQDVAVAGADSKAPPQLSVKTLYIDAAAVSLLRWGVVLDAVRIESPHLRLAQTAPGQWDMHDVLARLQSGTPPPSDAPPRAMPRFALYNVQLSDGRVQLHDQVTGSTHVLEHIALQLPFLSSLPSQRSVTVAPSLSFDLNGKRIASQAQSTPFTDTMQTAATLVVDDVDVQPYLAYWPQHLPVKLQAGRLSATVHAAFAQQDRPVLTLSGALRADGVQLQDRQGNDWLQWQALEVEVRRAEPLAQVLELGHVRWQQPRAALGLDASGALLQWPAPTHAAAPAAEAAPSAPWRIALAHGEVADGHVLWSDATVQPMARVGVQAINVSVRDVAWPMQRNAQWQGSLSLDGSTDHAAVRKPGGVADSATVINAPDAKAAAAPQPQLRWAGHGTPSRGQLGLVLDGLPLHAAQGYLAQWLQPTLQAHADGVVGLAWHDGQWQVAAPQLAVQQLRLGDARAPVAAWESLRMEDARVSITGQRLQAQLLQLDGPQLQATRDARGNWMYTTWLWASQPATAPTGVVPASVVGAAPPAASAAPAPAAHSAPGWALEIARLRIQEGAVTLADHVPARAVRMGLGGLQLEVTNWRSTPSAAPWGVDMRAQLQAVGPRGALRAQAGAGDIAFRGQWHTAPRTALQGRLQAQQLPLHLLDSYIDGLLNVRVLSALGSWSGDVHYTDTAQGPHVQLQGRAGLDQVHVQTVQRTQSVGKTTMQAGEDLLRWKHLQLGGVGLQLTSDKPLALQVQHTALEDFFARIVVQPNGRLNLQDLAIPTKSEAAQAHGTSDSVLNASENVGAQAADAMPLQVAAAGHAAPSAQPQSPMPQITMGPIALRGGAVKFSDLLIQPNYTAELSALHGTLGAFASHTGVEPTSAQGASAPKMADLQIQGVVQSTASLQIAGKLNPLAQPLALDITGKVRDLELPPLSPYAVKYAGHGIERGKLSVDVHYHVQPNGELTARNQLVLQQLTFGPEHPGAAQTLPVKLAVALLADRNGVIDVDVPISGSLNDPQFKLGSVIWQVIGNLVRKAITAPFALLAGAASESAQGSEVDFEPGQSQLHAAAQQQLQQVAKALLARPALQLTVVGSAHTESDALGWKTTHLSQQIQSGQNSIAPSAPLSDKEREARVRALYRQSSMEKPRNLVGMARTLSEEEMRTLLIAHMPLPATAMHELAAARAMAVRTYLAEQGVEMARLFVGNSRADGPDAGKKARLALAVH